MSTQPEAFDWNKIVNKNVKSNDMQDLGKVAEIDNDSFIILKDAARIYRIPKSRVDGFKGNDVLVDFRFNDLLLIELASLNHVTNADSRTDYDSTPENRRSKKTFVSEFN